MLRAAFVLLLAGAISAVPVHKFPLGESLLTYRKVLDLQNPSGSYFGSKSVLGEQINVEIDIVNTTQFNFSISGAISIACDYEAYTISGGSIVVNNIGVDGDCIHDALKEHTITLEGISYDSSADQVEVKVKYTFLSLTFTLTHKTSRFVAPISDVRRDPLALAHLLDRYINGQVPAALPSGEYDGDKSILGQDIHARVLFNENSSLNFTITGPLTIDCAYEPFTYSGGVITIPTVGSDSDCLHNALAQNGCSLGSFTFDELTNVLSVKVKYHSVVTLTLDLTHKQRVDTIAPITVIYRDYMNVMDNNIPLGRYEGSKTVLGKTIVGSIVLYGTTADISFTGIASISCSAVPYTYANDAVTIPSVSDPNTCLGGKLKAAGITFQSVDYNDGRDEITIVTKYSVVTITLTLNKVKVATPFPSLPAVPVSFANTVSEYYVRNVMQPPVGSFVGSTKVFGELVEAQAQFDAGLVNIQLNGLISLACESQPFSYMSEVVMVSGNCLNNALSRNGVSFKSFTYNIVENVVYLQVNHKHMTLTVALNHSA